MRKILVVDDSGLTRNEVKAMLEELGDTEVIIAENGQRALELLRDAKDVQMIVTDIEMPTMGGVELVQQLRAMDETMYLPILVMSTLGQVKERDQALNNGADAFIEKPVTAEALKELLSDLL